MFGHIGLPPDNSSVIIVIYDVILYYYIVHSILMATVKFIYTDNVTDNSPKLEQIKFRSPYLEILQ